MNEATQKALTMSAHLNGVIVKVHAYEEHFPFFYWWGSKYEISAFNFEEHEYYTTISAVAIESTNTDNVRIVVCPIHQLDQLFLKIITTVLQYPYSGLLYEFHQTKEEKEKE